MPLCSSTGGSGIADRLDTGSRSFDGLSPWRAARAGPNAWREAAAAGTAGSTRSPHVQLRSPDWLPSRCHQRRVAGRCGGATEHDRAGSAQLGGMIREPDLGDAFLACRTSTSRRSSPDLFDLARRDPRDRAVDPPVGSRAARRVARPSRATSRELDLDQCAGRSPASADVARSRCVFGAEPPDTAATHRTSRSISSVDA